MKILNIVTKRTSSQQSFWQVVYEWEDVFRGELNAKYVNDRVIRLNRNVRRLFRGNLNFLTPSTPSLIFEMNPDEHSGCNKGNIIPFIIDFYIKDKRVLSDFYKSYSKNKIVIVSSKEVYEFLKKENCPLPLAHIGLSIADKYINALDHPTQKVYDIALIGRQNPVLMEFVHRYEEEHREIIVVKKSNLDGKVVYKSSCGEILGSLSTREEYLNVLRRTKCVLYSTPSIDTDNKHANGFNQVTPKLLEYLSCGCNVLARYPQNADI